MRHSAEPVPTTPASEPVQAVMHSAPHRMIGISDADRDAIIAALPVRARELVVIFGFLPTIRALIEFGGERVVVPVKVPASDDHPLVARLGRETVEKLVSARPGDRFDMPGVTSIERLLRNNALRADFDAGVSVRELVARYRLSDRHVRMLLGEGASTTPHARVTPDSTSGPA